MLFYQETIRSSNKFKILILLSLVIIWRLSTNGRLLGKDLWGGFKTDVFGAIPSIVDLLFEMIGFFVVMIVLGEILRRTYRILVRQIGALKKEVQEKAADQETLNISILLTICFLIYTIS